MKASTVRAPANQTRFIRIGSADVATRPAVQALVDAATARAKTPFPVRGRGTLIIRSLSRKQRPRGKSAMSKRAL